LLVATPGTLRSYRQQAGVLVAGAGIAAGFLVGRAPVAGPAFIAGGVAFVLLLLAAGFVAWPVDCRAVFTRMESSGGYVDDQLAGPPGHFSISHRLIRCVIVHGRSLRSPHAAVAALHCGDHESTNNVCAARHPELVCVASR
jgi:hypothetical protein